MNSDSTASFEHLRSLEWIETNGVGGYASGTVSGANSRRYHGLLVAALKPPVERRVMLSKIEETLIAENATFSLSANQYPGVIHPEGHRNLKRFERDLFPVFTYEAGGIVIQKTIACIQGENTTLVLYEVLKAANAFRLELMPLGAFKDYHTMSHANTNIHWEYLFERDVFRTKNYDDSAELFIKVPGASFRPQQQWYFNFEYAAEQYRGLDFQEDLFTHGKFETTLHEGSMLGIIISTEDVSGKDAFDLFQNEKQRRLNLTKSYVHPKVKSLALAADQFIVNRGKGLKTIIAGYHWFSDWGRDTMISLPGLCLATGRFDDAKKILQAFAESVSEGMLPNRFPDYGETPEYNTVDATLWFFQAVYHYYQYTGDKTFVNELLPVLEDIVQWHYKGTRYGIHVDQDELLFSGADGVQLTWMDAKIGDWVVTPRKGKAVEINALWFNALKIIGMIHAENQNIERSTLYNQRAEKVKTNFNIQFWNPLQEYLFDVVDGDYKDDDLRPNQLYAISLPFTLLPKDQARKVFESVTEKLLTPRGLRSLSPDFEFYNGHYGGDQWHRDSSYHQGTVWSFLLGPYVDALMLLKNGRAKAEAEKIIQEFFEHLEEGGIGTVSEIFDGDAPHTPRGCIAQAWGIAEVLRVCIQHELFKEKNRHTTKVKPATERSPELPSTELMALQQHE